MSGMKDDNRGFTLVELLVSVAILAVILAAAGGFMVSGSGAYRSVSSSVDLQIESQTAMNQIRDYAVDCSAGICSADGKLFVLDRETAADGAVTWTEHIFSVTADGLEYTRKTTVQAADTEKTVTVSTEGGLISGRAESMTVTALTSGSVSIRLTFRQQSRTYTGEETMALRNTPAVYADEAALTAGVPVPTP